MMQQLSGLVVLSSQSFCGSSENSGPALLVRILDVLPLFAGICLGWFFATIQKHVVQVTLCVRVRARDSWNWRAVWGVPCLAPYVFWDGLQELIGKAGALDECFTEKQRDSVLEK